MTGARLQDGGSGSLDAGDVGEMREQAAREIALEATELEQPTGPEERLEGTHHHWVHHVEIEIVSVLVIRRIARLSVKVSGGRHRRVARKERCILATPKAMLLSWNP